MSSPRDLGFLVSILSAAGMRYRLNDLHELADLLGDCGVDVAALPPGRLEAVWECLQEVSPRPGRLRRRRRGGCRPADGAATTVKKGGGHA
jgi:hypothetical protein